MADLELKQIECDEFEEKDDTYTSTEFAEDEGEARFNAYEKAEPGAIAALFAVVNGFRCPRKKCPEMKLEMTLGRPIQGQTAKARVAPAGGALIDGFTSTWSCHWEVRIECVKGEIGGLHVTTKANPVKPQALACEDDGELVVSGNATGLGSNVIADDALKAAIDAAREKAQRVIQNDILKVHCLNADCPNRKITVLIGPISAATLPGHPTLTTYALANCPWGLKVSCVK